MILFGAGTDHNLVAGNRIGTDWTGAAALPNILHGVIFLPGPRRTRSAARPPWPTRSPSTGTTA